MEEWQNPQTIALWLVIIFAFVGMLAGSLVFLVRNNFNRIIHSRLEEAQLRLLHQQELLTVSIEAGENEKQHIASELHDHFGVNLSTLKIWIHQFNNAPTHSREKYYEKINELIDRNITDVRGLSHEIYPPMLREWGLIAALREVDEDLGSRMNLEIFPGAGLPVLDYATSLQLFRICQEFIQNSLRHGETHKVEIIFRTTPEHLMLCLSDKGRGFDPGEVKSGLGVKNMTARSQAIGAVSRLRSSGGKGTVFLIVKKRT